MCNMFFRRMFARKDKNGNGANAAYDYNDSDEQRDANMNRNERAEARALGGGATARGMQHNNGNGIFSNGSATGASNSSASNDYDFQRRRKHSASTAPPTTTKHSGSVGTLHHTQHTNAPATIQLTPLWEHILRTRTLPKDVYAIQIFDEFLERLRDPEWQVRQHALRVFVDVLVVMRDEADTYMDPLIPPLVENLGHQAPTVRKGALDCLRVYLAETAMPETILLQILDIGLNQKITNEPFGGRLTCGVMLSLPALVQSTLHTTKRHYILRTAIEMLVQKMGQVTHQEITLKVLSKLRELVGEYEFRDYMTKEAYREFELLCNVYGVDANSSACSGNGHGSARSRHACGNSGATAGSWHVLSKQSVPSCWRSSDEEQMLEEAARGKVIMETEIKINNDTLTMRILEAKDEDFVDNEDSSPLKSADKYSNSFEHEEVVCGRLPNAKHSTPPEISAVVRLLSDSDEDAQEDDGAKSEKEARRAYKSQNENYYTVVTPSTPSRTPKRVTFGGEVVKMRTPDSDANSSNNKNNNGAAEGHSTLFNAPAGNQNAIDAGGGAGDGGVQSKENIQHTITTTTTTTEITIISTPSTSATNSPLPDDNLSKTMELSVEIFNDNTKPLPESVQSPATPRPRTAQSTSKHSQVFTSATHAEDSSSPITSSNTMSSQSPPKRHDSAAVSPASTVNTLSPHTHFKRLNISPVDSIVSPKVPHKPIEVMHNLQRDPSPVRTRSAARRADAAKDAASSSDVGETSSGLLVTHATQTPRTQTPSPTPPKTWEELDIVDYDTILDLRSGNWHHRLQGITQLEEALRSSDTLAQVQPCLDSLLRTLLSSERNPDVSEAKVQLLINLITRLPLDNLEDRTTQIMNGLCRQGGAGANRVCKALMHRLPAAAIVLKLLSQEFLHAKSSRFREHALQMVMYALMTFPSTCFDTKTCVTQATYAALNRKRRVRQAALDVLAILGQITSIRAVLDVVQIIAAERDEGPALLSAVRTRLARKQMPLLSADGQVQYALRIPSSETAEASADIEWIIAGVGSVSPSSLRRRASRRSFHCLPPHKTSDVDAGALGTPCGNIRRREGESSRRHAFQSPPDVYESFKDSSASSHNDLHSHNFQHILGSNLPLHYGQTTKKLTNADYGNYLNRRLVAKSCSDSSMEGRSSDSTYTSSSGGGSVAGGSGGGDRSASKGNSGSAANTPSNDSCTGISGRFTRQAVNSRFPAMDRMDMNSPYMRIHKPPTYHSGMGAYAHLQQQQINMGSTYPRISNYGLTAPQQQQQQQHQQQQLQQQQQRRRSQQQRQVQPIVVGTRALQPSRGGVIGGAYVPDNFRSAENSPKEHNNSSNTRTANNNANSNLDDTYTIYESIDNKTNTPAEPDNRRFVNPEKFVMQRRRKSIGIAASNTGGVAGELGDDTRTVGNSHTNETLNGIVRIKQNNNVTFADWKQPLEEPQMLDYTEHLDTIQQRLICNGGSSGQQNNSTPVLTVPGIPNEHQISKANTLDGEAVAAVIAATTIADMQQRQQTPTRDSNKQVTPISIKSATYSQKSTVSAQSDIVGDSRTLGGTSKETRGQTNFTGNGDSENTSAIIQMGALQDVCSDNEGSTSPASTKWESDVDALQLEDLTTSNTIMNEGNMSSLNKNGSLASLHSKSESIKTQLGDTPTVLSRAQSAKSLLIEEDIDGGADGSFVVMDEDVQDERERREEPQPLRPISARSRKEDTRASGDVNFDAVGAHAHTPAHNTPTHIRSRSPTIAEIKALSRRNSMIKSMESLYERPPTRQAVVNNFDNASTESGSAASSQINTVMIPIKPQHTPLKQKAKTSHFLKSRRVSPVKQAIKMTPPAELYPTTLQRFEKPREALLKTFDQLDSSSWEVIMLGLKSIVRLMRYHAEYLETQMHMVCIQLTRSVRNLRSQVARAACQASTELFTIKSKCLEQECDDLVCALLHRTADTNRFLRADATRALESMCDNLTPVKVLNILTTKGVAHQHALVRTTAAKLLHRLVERLGSERVYTMQRENRDKFFVTSANLLLEGSLETRSYAKSIFKLLSDHPNYQRLLTEVIPQRTYRNVEKTLKSIR